MDFLIDFVYACVPVRDRVLAKADHAVSIDNQAVKLKVSKPGSGSHTEGKSQQAVSGEFAFL